MFAKLTPVLLLISYLFLASPVTAEQRKISLLNSLVEVNNEWGLYVAEFFNLKGERTIDNDPVYTHLSSVIELLESRQPDFNDKSLELARDKNISRIKSYTKSREFPVNTLKKKMTPIFIDDFSNYCAVGHLLKVSGEARLAKAINSEFRFSKINEIKNPGLLIWQKKSGLSMQELALIQPGYDGLRFICSTKGQGTKPCLVLNAVQENSPEALEKALGGESLKLRNQGQDIELAELAVKTDNQEILNLLIRHDFSPEVILRYTARKPNLYKSTLELLYSEKPEGLRSIYLNEYHGWQSSKRMVDDLYSKKIKVKDLDLETSLGLFVSTNRELKEKYHKEIAMIQSEEKNPFAFERALGGSLVKGKNHGQKIKYYKSLIEKTYKGARKVRDEMIDREMRDAGVIIDQRDFETKKAEILKLLEKSSKKNRN